MVEITRAGVKDHGIVTSLLMEFARSQGIDPLEDCDGWDRIIARLLDSDSWVFMLAGEEDRPVGLAVVSFSIPLYGTGERARLEALVVAKEKKREGVGSLLLDEVLTAVKRRGCRVLEAGLTGHMDEAIGFLRNLDWAESILLTLTFADEDQ